jgi:hypothetical protein
VFNAPSGSATTSACGTATGTLTGTSATGEAGESTLVLVEYSFHESYDIPERTVAVIFRETTKLVLVGFCTKTWNVLLCKIVSKVNDRLQEND